MVDSYLLPTSKSQNAPQNFGALPKFGAQKNIKFWPMFSATYMLDLKQNVAPTNKNASVNLRCVP